MKVALVHYWLVGMRGGERVLEALCEMFPDADVYTHVYDPGAISPSITRHQVFTTFIGRLPRARVWYQRYLPLMPIALEQLDLRKYDLVISSESGPAKGVLVNSEALHVCYCHTPMRYLWDMYHLYRESAGGVTGLLMPWVMHYLRIWDLASAARVDYFVANSRHTAQRVAKRYRRRSVVIPPPVDTKDFTPSGERGEYYLVAGQLVPYKRTDIAVEAFSRIGKPLIVVGDGPDLKVLRRRASPTVTFVGWQNKDSLRRYYARCRALIFPGEEDFGIVPVEAMASGRPVIAYNRGGATETVRDRETGLLFNQQTPEALIDAVTEFERTEDRFVPEVIARHAKQFDREVFQQRMRAVIDDLLAGKISTEA